MIAQLSSTDAIPSHTTRGHTVSCAEPTKETKRPSENPAAIHCHIGHSSQQSWYLGPHFCFPNLWMAQLNPRLVKQMVPDDTAKLQVCFPPPYCTPLLDTDICLHRAEVSYASHFAVRSTNRITEEEILENKGTMHQTAVTFLASSKRKSHDGAGEKTDSAVKSPGCSSKRSVFNSQYQPSITLVTGDLMASFGTRHTHGAETHLLENTPYT